MDTKQSVFIRPRGSVHSLADLHYRGAVYGLHTLGRTTRPEMQDKDTAVGGGSADVVIQNVLLSL